MHFLGLGFLCNFGDLPTNFYFRVSLCYIACLFAFIDLRSLAKKLRNEVACSGSSQHDNSNLLPACLGSSQQSKPVTLLDMHFSDGEDEEELKSVEATEGSAPREGCDPVVPHPRDEDYQPTVEDMNIMHRDILYDLEETDLRSVCGSAQEDQEVGDDSDTSASSLYTVEPLSSPHRDYFLRSRKSDEVNMQDCFGGLTPNLLNLLDEDEGSEEVERNAQRFADALTATNNCNDTDPEEQIYTSFLKSLVDSTSNLDGNLSPKAGVVSIFLCLFICIKMHYDANLSRVILAVCGSHAKSRSSRALFGKL